MTIKDALKATGRGLGSALNATGEVILAVSEYNRKVEEMANLLMQKTPGLELTQAKLVAKTLVDKAEEINWK
jgi:hypothetical protein